MHDFGCLEEVLVYLHRWAVSEFFFGLIWPTQNILIQYTLWASSLFVCMCDLLNFQFIVYPSPSHCSTICVASLIFDQLLTFFPPTVARYVQCLVSDPGLDVDNALM